MDDTDRQVRLAAFHWLESQTLLFGDVLPRSLLQEGFYFKGARVPLVAPKGIHKPKVLELPLTITTSPDRPYDDRHTEEGLLLYKYRGTNSNHPDNVGLRELLLRDIPLIYLHGIVTGKYLPSWPVFVVGDDPAHLAFTMAVDDYSAITRSQRTTEVSEATDARRSYVTAVVMRRVHQRTFREKVLKAYRESCALCRLRHTELLDAAHIVPDSEPEGIPTVTNGIALCKLHHGAFDNRFLGISPDYRIHIRQDILDEQDGPMLLHGLQELHGNEIHLPRNEQYWPDRRLLDLKFQMFRAT